MRLAFIAYGLPAPQGSARAFYQANKNRAVIVKDNDERQRSWRSSVSDAAAKAMAGHALIDGPMVIRLRFVFPKPKSVKRAHPATRPDLDKLLRACFDAMTGIVYTDDARIVETNASKQYGEPARAEVEVYAL